MSIQPSLPESILVVSCRQSEISRIVDDSPWHTLDEYQDEMLFAAVNLDISSFPQFLIDNGTNQWFTWLLKTFRDDQVVFLDIRGEKVLAAGFSAPIHLDNDLPENGWEGAVEQIRADYQKRAPNALVAFSASVSPEARGQRMGDKVLKAVVQRAKELGLEKVIVPARPSGKSSYPDESMESYANRYDQATGQHVDPWIRAHMRCGGKVVGVGKNSHVVLTTNGEWPNKEQWKTWTGMDFPGDGAYDIPRGNAKLVIHDGVGEYREDCIWIEYDLTESTSSRIVNE